jgi:ABC-type polysaccharide/polyol phosphate export permease
MTNLFNPAAIRRVIKQNRTTMSALIVRDFKTRYLASYIGLPWAFIQPVMYVFVIWFAFTFGLRGGRTLNGTPFVAWLIVAMAPWLFISQTMIVSCNSIIEYSYLIKKTAFNVNLIPIIKIFSGLIVHSFLMLTVVFLLAFSFGINPSIYWIQIFYYQFAMIFLLTGIVWFVSSINVFIRDMAHIVSIIVTMMFWATPIIWPYSKLQGGYRYIALLNPFFYITEGYRYTFIEKIWFFEFFEMNIYFWGVTIILFVLGTFTFNKLKKDFGDVL